MSELELSPIGEQDDLLGLVEMFVDPVGHRLEERFQFTPGCRSLVLDAERGLAYNVSFDQSGFLQRPECIRERLRGDFRNSIEEFVESLWTVVL